MRKLEDLFLEFNSVFELAHELRICKHNGVKIYFEGNIVSINTILNTMTKYGERSLELYEMQEEIITAIKSKGD